MRLIEFRRRFHVVDRSMEFCDICDCAHVPTASRCNSCKPKWWARGWKRKRCHGSCVLFPHGCAADGCVKVVDEFRRIGAHMKIDEDFGGLGYKDFDSIGSIFLPIRSPPKPLGLDKPGWPCALHIDVLWGAFHVLHGHASYDYVSHSHAPYTNVDGVAAEMQCSIAPVSKCGQRCE